MNKEIRVIIEVLGFWASSFMKLFMCIIFMYVYYNNGGTSQIVKWFTSGCTLIWIIDDFIRLFVKSVPSEQSKVKSELGGNDVRVK